MPIPIELPEHGDITESDFDARGRFYIELWDMDLNISRRFYEDVRITNKREKRRDVIIGD
jgi:hypothetical protein